ncbi:hypothetical protein LX32DRAFT_649896 [Colletotrichum zoysiae]|uniref:Uncharacterized protein n=1 Tax=Colletotrichum zoysiae TaxID=1216348 RepID=A0AAD9HQX4_9PEZI|nr:hypothetical protein LX32DRAFT_649896 [Colletotrichum zoysiae]
MTPKDDNGSVELILRPAATSMAGSVSCLMSPLSKSTSQGRRRLHLHSQYCQLRAGTSLNSSAQVGSYLLTDYRGEIDEGATVLRREEDVDSLPLIGTGPDPRRTVMPLDMIVAGRGHVFYLNGIHDDARTLWLLKPSTSLVFIGASTTDKAGVLPAIRLSGGSAALAVTFT